MPIISASAGLHRKMHTWLNDEHTWRHRLYTRVQLVHKCTEWRCSGSQRVKGESWRVSHYKCVCVCVLGKWTSLVMALCYPPGSTQRCETGHRLHAAAVCEWLNTDADGGVWMLTPCSLEFVDRAVKGDHLLQTNRTPSLGYITHNPMEKVHWGHEVKDFSFRIRKRNQDLSLRRG